jgi:Phosphate-selective porin O and P
MQRHLISFLSLVAFTASAQAQPAPDAPPAAQPPVNASTDPAPVAPAPADPTAPPADGRPPEARPPEAMPAARPPEDMPRKLAVGKDSQGAFFTPGLLLQGWFVDDVTTGKTAAGDDTTVSTLSTFRIRRAEISASGEMIPKFLRYKVMFDPSRVRDTLTRVNAVDAAGAPVVVSTPVSALSTLQDLYITFQSELADVSIGQFKIPVSWEGFNSSAKILLPERAFVSNLFGDKRDLGLRVEKTFEKVGYVAGIYNGAALDNFDNNNQKDLSLRLEVYPVKGMTIAGVAYDSVGYRTRAGTKDRWEADFRYETGPFLVQAEYLRAVDVNKAEAKDCKNAGGKCTAQGGYAALAYTLKDLGTGNWQGSLQPVVRVGFYDNDVDNPATDAMQAAEIERMDYEVGANYYLRHHEMKLQVSYDRQQFTNPAAATTRQAVNEIILAAQVWF